MNNLVRNDANLQWEDVEVINNYLANLFVVRGKLDTFTSSDHMGDHYEELKDYVSDEMELLTERLKRNGGDPVGTSETVFQRSTIDVNASQLWEDIRTLANDLRAKKLDLLSDAISVYDSYSERLRTLEA
ncbi:MULTISPECIES: hypothetical protein [Pontibacillus]|uniref:Uncharacterized protein n=1 Tax=Pontibacillus chungwhensis TaxID=265426 RepID=A0ABY8UST7_9BACI|nr:MULTISPECIES: hypothetical protein [Pontibacillus]MCD5323187.1 hypothetical protein [Pontibacillus sp. HN14]WIF96574.1 hypothetical protein QNI29_12515 [Pontibacillus chungwhensis]